MQIGTIIYLTDFSVSAQNAANYAVTISETFYAKLVLTHILDLEDSDVPEIRRNNQSEIKKARTRLDDMKLEFLQRNPLLNITTVVLTSRTKEKILEHISIENADLTIIGAHTEAGILNSDENSFAAQIIKESICPVLVIPYKAVSPRFNSIVYASDLDFVDITAIRELTDFASYYNAEVSILNIADPSRRFSEEQLFHFEKQVRETARYPKLDFIYLHGPDINQSIQYFLQRNKADLLVMTSIKGSIVNRLIDDVNKKVLGYHNTLPLLTFHERDKCCQKVA
jgi:nucleotide-binding universal stress UspA family protein